MDPDLSGDEYESLSHDTLVEKLKYVGAENASLRIRLERLQVENDHFRKLLTGEERENDSKLPLASFGLLAHLPTPKKSETPEYDPPSRLESNPDALKHDASPPSHSVLRSPPQVALDDPDSELGNLTGQDDFSLSQQIYENDDSRSPSVAASLNVGIKRELLDNDIKPRSALKRRRMVLDCVEIPVRRSTPRTTSRPPAPSPKLRRSPVTSGSALVKAEVPVAHVPVVRVKPEPSTEEKLDEFIRVKRENPEIKIRPENRVLPESSIRARLALVNNISYVINDVPEEVQRITVTRAFFSKTFGGNTQATFPSIGKKFRQKHPYRNFMMLNLDEYNPEAPKNPGDAGLFFGLGNSEGSDWGSDGHIVFVRLRRNMWLQVGIYTMSPAPSLTIEEWNSQKAVVKTTWAEDVWEQSWGRDTRAIIVLWRELGRRPTQDELDDALDTNRTFQNLSLEEIVDAFSTGKETIAVWCMECIGYEADLQRDIVENLKTWVPPPPRPRKSKKKATGGRKSQKSAPPSKRPQKLEESEEGEGEESEEESSEEPNEPEDNIEELPYVHRGTGSRPRLALID